jgi:hypothetical protein
VAKPQKSFKNWEDGQTVKEYKFVGENKAEFGI